MTPTIQTAMDLHRQGRLDEAETHYRSLLTTSPTQFDALHLFGILKLQQGNFPEALTLISKAVEINPSSLDTRSNLVAVLLNLGRAADALGHCNSILAVSPADSGALYHRGLALAQLGRHDEALGNFDKVLTIKSDHVNALFNRAGVLAGLQRYEDAIADFDRLLAFVPRHADALTNRGTLLAQLGRDNDAVASFDRALAVAPAHVNALTNRGIALKKLARRAEALVSLDRAIAIKPDHAEAYVNRGNVLIDLNRFEDALASFQRALALDPMNANALTNQAFALNALGRYQAALESCDMALRFDPGHANAFLFRGHALAKLDRPVEAAASYEQILLVDPSNVYAFGASLMAHRAACNWGRIAQLLPAIEPAVRAGTVVIPPFTLLGFPIAPDVQLRCASNYVRQLFAGEPKPFPARTHDPSKKIKVGYVSADFRRHPTSYLLAELFECHDRTRFEVIGISYGKDDGSDIRRRIVESLDQFHDIRDSDDRAAAALIDELGIDIAVDLAGYTESARSGIFRLRPAPIQVNYLGYPGTVGANFIDYIIADKTVVPLEHAPHYAEKIVHLPDCYQVNDRRRAIASSSLTRRDAGLPEDGMVFCCFNNLSKITAPVFDAWMRLLPAVPGSVVWLLGDAAAAEANLRREALARGVDPERLVFAGRLDLADHLARHRLADLFLDTLPYNAHTTASDALWAGLPVLTCVGTAFPGRVAASLLHAIGLPELVTASLDDYEALALKLAGDPALLQSIRSRLDANRLTHPLFDTDRFRRHIEAAYATMLDIARRGEPPRSFSVDPIGA